MQQLGRPSRLIGKGWGTGSCTVAKTGKVSMAGTASLGAMLAAPKAGSDTGGEDFASHTLLCIPCPGRKDVTNSQ